VALHAHEHLAAMSGTGTYRCPSRGFVHTGTLVGIRAPEGGDATSTDAKRVDESGRATGIGHVSRSGAGLGVMILETSGIALCAAPAVAVFAAGKIPSARMRAFVESEINGGRNAYRAKPMGSRVV
jgi:hypothetical protein